MGFPCTLGQLHLCENSLERGFLWRTGIDAEAYLPCTLMQVAYTHLGEAFSIGGALYAVIIFAARKPIPHGLYLCRNGCSGPVGITVVGYHASQVLILLIFILYAPFQPVVAVQIEHYAALVKPLMAVRKVSLHYEAEKLLFGLHLEYGSIVVAEMIVGALPEVGLRLGDHLYGITFDDATLWFPGPAEFA